jgi:hypothetical protein
MDGIFDRKDFVGSFIWKKKSGGGNDSKYIVNEHELGVIKIIVIIKTVVACVIWRVNVNQFYFSSKVAFKGV